MTTKAERDELRAKLKYGSYARLCLTNAQLISLLDEADELERINERYKFLQGGGVLRIPTEEEAKREAKLVAEAILDLWHPIDAPTEPGHYWWWQSETKRWVIIEMFRAVPGVMLARLYIPEPEDGWAWEPQSLRPGTFYGPRIPEPPQPEKTP